MLPFYIYYSMFGFQRVGDQIWAAADQRPRGFLLGATSGRTTLGGEGLQHQDGSSHLHAATIPNCKAYDPAFAGEMAVIVNRGIRDMMIEQQDVFYYITLMNENYAQPSLPAAMHEQVIRGCYLFETFEAQVNGSVPADSKSSFKNKADATPTGVVGATATSNASPAAVTLLGSGAILTEVIKAARQLADQGVTTYVYSVTSWSELARDGLACQDARLAGSAAAGVPFIYTQLGASQGPIVAATDYVHALPESVRAYLPADRRYLTLGTDGFGRSDTRAALREYFGVDAAAIVRAAVLALE
jgi:pyruvate dehydrogenase E1 component